MKLIMENWKKFLDENEEMGPDYTPQLKNAIRLLPEAMEHLKTKLLEILSNALKSPRFMNNDDPDDLLFRVERLMFDDPDGSFPVNIYSDSSYIDNEGLKDFVEQNIKRTEFYKNSHKEMMELIHFVINVHAGHIFRRKLQPSELAGWEKIVAFLKADNSAESIQQMFDIYQTLGL